MRCAPCKIESSGKSGNGSAGVHNAIVFERKEKQHPCSKKAAEAGLVRILLDKDTIEI
jgi:hypothetical protein